MRFVADHDFHIHSTLSLCCHDENQTPQAILNYAKDNNFNKICLTNHFWDERVASSAKWHEAQQFAPVSSALPLPQADGISFLFGAETDMDYNYIVGVSKERYDCFDFIVVPTTHLHLAGNTVKTKIQTPDEGAELWLNRIKALLNTDMPWHKTGIAHLTCGHIFGNRTPEVIALLRDGDLQKVFCDCAQKGVGIELNLKTLSMSQEEKDILLRPYHIAKDCGCKFYLCSDAHKVDALKSAKENFENIITLLDLQEKDKFILT